MSKRTKILSLCVAGLMATGLLVSCVPSAATMLTPEQIRQVGMDAGLTDDSAAFDSLRRGRIIATTACSDCHRTFMPGEYSTKEWRRFVRTMGKRTGLSKVEKANLERYLIACNLALAKQERDRLLNKADADAGVEISPK